MYRHDLPFAVHERWTTGQGQIFLGHLPYPHAVSDVMGVRVLLPLVRTSAHLSRLYSKQSFILCRKTIQMFFHLKILSVQGTAYTCTRRLFHVRLQLMIVVSVNVKRHIEFCSFMFPPKAGYLTSCFALPSLLPTLSVFVLSSFVLSSLCPPSVYNSRTPPPPPPLLCPCPILYNSFHLFVNACPLMSNPPLDF